MKGIICLLLALCLLAACASASAESPALTEGEHKALDFLAQGLEKDADRQIATLGEITDLYPELPASSFADADSFPGKFDLRDRGILTPIKNQSPWGACWTFGTSAACETSLLSMMGLTADGYREKYGVDMDISERHLAWFTAFPLPEVSAYPEGEYPYDASQAGEGCRIRDGNYPLMIGGTYLLSASSLAMGIGIVAESIAPYESNNVLPEGADLQQGDWSLPEDYRFLQSFQLKNTNVLPSPAGRDGNSPRKIGEVLADLTGMSLTLDLARKDADFDYDAFFRAFAWFFLCYMIDPVVNMPRDIATNPHPLPYIRINFTVQHFDEFYQTYPSVTEGTPMYLAPEDRLLIW